jgi:hypothetical protein
MRNRAYIYGRPVQRDFTAPVVTVVTPPPDTESPGAPTGLAASSITSTGFTLSWTAPVAPDVAYYNVFVNDIQVNPSRVFVTNYALTGLAPGTAYSLKVVAVDTSDNPSAASSALIVTTSAAPGGSIVAEVLAYDTLRINFPYAVRARRHPAKYVWDENYGFSISFGGINNVLIEHISAAGSQLTLRLAGRILPGESVQVLFVDVPTAPKQAATGSAIGDFAVSTTFSASFPGPVYYVSPTGNDANPGTQLAPWATIAKANTVTAVNSTVLFQGGAGVAAFTGLLSPRPGVTYANYGGGRAKIDNTNTVAYGCIEAIGQNGAKMVFRGLDLKNRHDQYSRNGVHMRNSANAEFWNMYISRGTNGIFLRGTGNTYLVKGCEVYECSNSGIFCMGEESASAISNVTIAFNHLHKLLANATVALNDLLTFHEKFENIGFLGASHRIYGNRINNITAEELIDITTGSDYDIENNDLFDCKSDQVVFGWSAKNVRFRYNYMVSGAAGQQVSTSFVRSRVGEATTVMRFQFNITEGPVFEPASGNGRGVYVFVGSNVNAGENPQNMEISFNTHIMPGNGQTALGLIPHFVQFLSLAGRPNPQDVRFRNNLMVTPSSGSQIQSSIEFYDAGLFTYTSAEWKPTNNQYVNSSGVLYKVGGSQINLATVQAAGKEANSTHSATQPVWASGWSAGPHKWRPAATGHNLISAIAVADGATTLDFESYFTDEAGVSLSRAGAIQPRTYVL